MLTVRRSTHSFIPSRFPPYLFSMNGVSPGGDGFFWDLDASVFLTTCLHPLNLHVASSSSCFSSSLQGTSLPSFMASPWLWNSAAPLSLSQQCEVCSSLFQPHPLDLISRLRHLCPRSALATWMALTLPVGSSFDPDSGNEELLSWAYVEPGELAPVVLATSYPLRTGQVLMSK